MKILVYGINFSPEMTGIGKYTGEMVEYLSKHCDELKVITAPPYYPEWEIKSGHSNRWSKLKRGNVTIHRCPLFVPKVPTTLKRLIHLSSFALSSFFPLLSQRKWKPDLIVCIAPSLMCMPGSVILRKITKAKVILHIQDYEVDAMLGLGLAKRGFLTRLAKSFETWCLQSADVVSTISHSMIRKAEEKGVLTERLLFFPNWSEVERFSSVTEQQKARMFSLLSIPNGKRIILYSGNIGEKQGLEIVLEVAKTMLLDDVIFLIVGAGGGKDRLIKLAESMSLTNVFFHPLQEYNDLPALLSIADCHLIIQKRGAADAVLPSKLTNILAVGGNSVITAEVDTELGQLCNKYPGIGVCVEPESPQTLCEGIQHCLSQEKPNVIAIDYAQKYLSKQKVLGQFIDDIKGGL